MRKVFFAATVKLFAACLRQVPDPRHSRGSSQTFHDILATTILALFANASTVKGIRRRRTEYEVDLARCVVCGRCFWYCPNQKEQRILLTVEESDPPTPV